MRRGSDRAGTTPTLVSIHRDPVHSAAAKAGAAPAAVGRVTLGRAGCYQAQTVFNEQPVVSLLRTVVIARPAQIARRSASRGWPHNREFEAGTPAKRRDGAIRDDVLGLGRPAARRRAHRSVTAGPRGAFFDVLISASPDLGFTLVGTLAVSGGALLGVPGCRIGAGLVALWCCRLRRLDGALGCAIEMVRDRRRSLPVVWVRLGLDVAGRAA
jgi:hypothetical protein